MSIERISAPAQLAVTLADAKANLRYEADEDDPAIDALVSGWVGGLVAAVEDITKRSLIKQRWRFHADAFPFLRDGTPAAIVLPRPPIISVDLLEFRDPNGDWLTLDPADYEVDPEGFIVVAPGCTWPTTSPRIRSVRGEATTGYGDDPSAIPEQIRLHILAKLVDQFGAKTGNQIPAKPYTTAYIDALLDPFIIYD